MIVWTIVQIIVLVSIGGTFIWAFTRPMENEKVDVIREKVFTALGAVLIVISFLYLPWLKFNIFGYFGEMVETLVDVMPALLTGVLERWGPDGIETAGELLGELLDLLQIRGWLLWLTTPDIRIGVTLLRIVALLLPPILALFILLWSPILLFVTMQTRSLRLNRAISWIESILGFWILFLLVAHTPEIDAWGTTGNTVLGLVAASLGTEVGWGVYVVMFGLALIIFGGYAQYRQRWTPSAQPQSKGSSTWTRGGRT